MFFALDYRVWCLGVDGENASSALDYLYLSTIVDNTRLSYNIFSKDVDKLLGVLILLGLRLVFLFIGCNIGCIFIFLCLFVICFQFRKYDDDVLLIQR